MNSYRNIPAALLFLWGTVAHAQPANKINFSYWYDNSSDVKLQFHPVRQKDSIVVFFTAITKTLTPSTYRIQWEKRDSYSQRQGAMILPNDSIHVNNGRGEGKMKFAVPEKPWLLVAQINSADGKKIWTFLCQIEQHYPVNGYFEKNGIRKLQSFIPAADRYTVHGSGSANPIFFSYYQDNFPTPSPPFADKELKMDRFLFPDSTFSAMPGQVVGPFLKEGLYLAQEDTASSLGFSYLIKKDPYPKYNKLADLKGPLLFVTTREENDLIGNAGEDKTKFDKVILNITQDKERAVTFMRNYFKRVEYANYAFTSFKEGWKTDRGMIIIIFGSPDEVSLDDQLEIWSYKNPKQTFVFRKAGSVYGPDYFVLERNKSYTEYWYYTIDLWRKSRF